MGVSHADGSWRLMTLKYHLNFAHFVLIFALGGQLGGQMGGLLPYGICPPSVENDIIKRQFYRKSTPLMSETDIELMILKGV